MIEALANVRTDQKTSALFVYHSEKISIPKKISCQCGRRFNKGWRVAVKSGQNTLWFYYRCGPCFSRMKRKTA